MWPNIPQPKLGNNYLRIFSNFHNCAWCKEGLKDDKHNSLHLGQKHAPYISFVLGHYLFFKGHSFPRATHSGKYSLLGTDNVHELTSQHIFLPNGGYSLYTSQMTLELQGQRGEGVLWTGILTAWRVLSLLSYHCNSKDVEVSDGEDKCVKTQCDHISCNYKPCKQLIDWCKNSKALSAEGQTRNISQTRNIRGLK